MIYIFKEISIQTKGVGAGRVSRFRRYWGLFADWSGMERLSERALTGAIAAAAKEEKVMIIKKE
ncbi:MAG: hypothetical protein H0M93_04785 [Methanophagales archaeon]|nr:hypothetical protein [Methanophagales archaeon]